MRLPETKAGCEFVEFSMFFRGYMLTKRLLYGIIIFAVVSQHAIVAESAYAHV